MDSAEEGEKKGADEYLPEIYSELRKLAQYKMSQEAAGQTLSATALVHEAYLRMNDNDADRKFEDQKHFFCSAAEAMRRILIDRARAKKRIKRGGEMERADLTESQIIAPIKDDEILNINEALEAFEQVDAETSEIVKLRYFAGMTWDEISNVTGTPERSLRRKWTYAKAWLKDWMNKS